MTASRIYVVKVTPGTTGSEFELFYASASGPDEAVEAVRAQVGSDHRLETDGEALTDEKAKRLGLLSGQVRLG